MEQGQNILREKWFPTEHQIQRSDIGHDSVGGRWYFRKILLSDNFTTQNLKNNDLFSTVKLCTSHKLSLEYMDKNCSLPFSYLHFI